jgi:simple sugar transport system ATP-binding protein
MVLPPAESRAARLSLSLITKAFPGVIANQDILLDIRASEVHAILGENGAGKSTLMKILYGFYQPDSGTIRAGERVVQIHSPADGKRLGIGMVFQQFMLAPALSVLENVALAVRDGRAAGVPRTDLRQHRPHARSKTTRSATSRSCSTRPTGWCRARRARFPKSSLTPCTRRSGSGEV